MTINREERAQVNSREVLRVGLPIEVGKLGTILGTVDAEATVRHYNGMLIIEEAAIELPLDGDSTDDLLDVARSGNGVNP